MKLKTKVLLSIAFLGSVLSVVPAVGAVRGGGKKASATVSATRKSGEYAGKTKRNLKGQEAWTLIVSWVAPTRQDRINLDQGRTTIWHILVAKKKWHAIRCLLGTDGCGLLAKEVVELYRKSFVDCVGDRGARVPLQTPLSLAEQQNTVAELRSCVPSNLSPDLKRRLPPVLNTFRHQTHA